MKSTLAGLTLSAMVLVGCETLPDGVNTFVTRERASVLWTSIDQPFTVRLRAGFGAPDFWCAAGRFAERQGPGTTRIFRLTPTPRPQGEGMTFTLIQPPPGVAQPSGLARIGGDPTSLSVFEATRLCRTSFLNTSFSF